MKPSKGLLLGVALSSTLICGCALDGSTLAGSGTTSQTAALAWPDRPEIYFRQTERTVAIPLDAIARPPGISPPETAFTELQMRWLAQGIGKKLDPLLARPDGRGNFVIIADTSAYLVAREHGLTQVLAVVLAPGEEVPDPTPPKPELQEASRQLQDAIDAGRLAGTVEGHIEIARRVIEAHRRAFVGTIDELQAALPGTIVIGRIKSLPSTLGKLVRNANSMDSAEDLYDVTGTRVIHESLTDIESAATRLRRRYHVVSERDYLSRPRGGYRAYHLIVRWPDGLIKEIQLATRNQHQFAELAHDAYKPKNAQQRQALETHRAIVIGYYAALGAYLWDLDRNEPSEVPDCPDVVRSWFHCL